MSNNKKKHNKLKKILLQVFAFLALLVIFVVLFGTIFSLISLMIAKNTNDRIGGIVLFVSFILTGTLSLTISIVTVFFLDKLGKFSSFVKKNWQYFLFLIILTVIFLISVYYSIDNAFEPAVPVIALEWAIFAITIAIFVFTVQHQIKTIEKTQIKDPKKLIGLNRFDQIMTIESIKNSFLNTRITIIFIFANASFLILSTGAIALPDFFRDSQFKSFLFLLSFYLTTNSFLHVLTSLITAYTDSKHKFLEQSGTQIAYDVDDEFINSAAEELSYSIVENLIDENKTLDDAEKEVAKNACIKALIDHRENKTKEDKKEDDKIK